MGPAGCVGLVRRRGDLGRLFFSVTGESHGDRRSRRDLGQPLGQIGVRPYLGLLPGGRDRGKNVPLGELAGRAGAFRHACHHEFHRDGVARLPEGDDGRVVLRVGHESGVFLVDVAGRLVLGVESPHRDGLHVRREERGEHLGGGNPVVGGSVRADRRHEKLRRRSVRLGP